MLTNPKVKNISYDYKAFLINLHFLNIAAVALNTLVWLEKSMFHGEKVHKSDRQSAQQVRKKGQKKFFHFTNTIKSIKT